MPYLPSTLSISSLVLHLAFCTANFQAPARFLAQGPVFQFLHDVQVINWLTSHLDAQHTLLKVAVKVLLSMHYTPTSWPTWRVLPPVHVSLLCWWLSSFDLEFWNSVCPLCFSPSCIDSLLFICGTTCWSCYGLMCMRPGVSPSRLKCDVTRLGMSTCSPWMPRSIWKAVSITVKQCFFSLLLLLLMYEYLWTVSLPSRITRHRILCRCLFVLIDVTTFPVGHRGSMMNWRTVWVLTWVQRSDMRNFSWRQQPDGVHQFTLHVYIDRMEGMLSSLYSGT